MALSRGQLHELLPHDGGPPRCSRLAAGVYTCRLESQHGTGVHVRPCRRVFQVATKRNRVPVFGHLTGTAVDDNYVCSCFDG